MANVFDAPVAAVPLGEPDRGDLGVAEHGVGNEAVVHGHRVVRVGQVVAHHPGLVVGHVLELDRVGDVAQGPHPFDAGPAVTVGDHIPGLVYLDARCGRVEGVAVGDAARGHQQRVAPDEAPDQPPVALADDLQLDPVAAPGGRYRPSAGHHLEPAPVGLGEPGLDVVVLVAQEAVAPDDEDDLGPEGAQHAPQLGRDVAASQHDQALGAGLDAHDGVGGVVAAVL